VPKYAKDKVKYVISNKDNCMRENRVLLITMFESENGFHF